MKRNLVLAILITLLLVALCSCTPPTPQEPTYFTLNYTAGVGGSIQGEVTQTVEQDKDGDAVVAVAISGYEFEKWSDGITTATRQDECVQEDITVTALFKKVENLVKSYTITYLVEEGATLKGEAVQTISQDDYETSIVSVKVRDGYEFLGWSDGHDITWRSDTYASIDNNYKKDTTFIARIRRIDDYNLLDWYSVFGEGVPTMTINEETCDSLSFPIPTREHFTFEGWYLGDTLVADTQGKSYFTRELLEEGKRSITARWTANETFAYKILLVYVTRIDAILPHVNPTITEEIHVDYTMSELEREFCHLTTARTKMYLDKMLDGLVDFQVDEYFLTETMTNKDFVTSIGDRRPSRLYLKDIDEVKDILPQYDSGLILYDALRETTFYSGSANMRYGEIRLDSFKSSINTYNATMEQVVELMRADEDLLLWEGCSLIDDYLIGTIVHELAHTIELRMNLYSYHKAFHSVYLNPLNEFESNRQYYLHEIIKDGEKVGIPYEFWKRDIGRVIYRVSQGIDGDAGDIVWPQGGTQLVPGRAASMFEVIYGESITVTATPGWYYQFSHWSDGVTTAERTDLVDGDIDVTAIFKPIDYELNVELREGGIVREGVTELSDETTYILNIEKQYIVLGAIANDGYKFVAWSDGDTSWAKYISARNLRDIADENNHVTLYAIFEKIE